MSDPTSDHVETVETTPSTEQAPETTTTTGLQRTEGTRPRATNQPSNARQRPPTTTPSGTNLAGTKVPTPSNGMNGDGQGTGPGPDPTPGTPSGPDACAGTISMATVANANEPGAYEMNRSTGALTFIARSVGPASYSPDGRFITYAAGPETQGHLCYGDLQTKSSRALVSNKWIPAYPNFPPRFAGVDHIVYAQQDMDMPFGYGAYVYDLKAGTTKRIAQDVGVIAVNPGGTTIAYAKRSGTNEHPENDLYVVPVAGGVPRHLVHVADTYVIAAKWSPDGRTLAIGDPFMIVDAATGASATYATCNIGALSFAWSPDSKRVAFTTEYYPDQCTFTVDRATGAKTQISNAGYAQDWSHDGRLTLAGHSPESYPSWADAWLEEITVGSGARRRLLHVPAVENHHQYLVADYTDDGKTIRIGHTNF